jgi:hypothetical protein
LGGIPPLEETDFRLHNSLGQLGGGFWSLVLLTTGFFFDTMDMPSSVREIGYFILDINL